MSRVADGAHPEPPVGQIMDVVASGSNIVFSRLLLLPVYTSTLLFLSTLIKLKIYLQQIYHAILKFYGIMQYVPKSHANVSVVS